MLAPYSIAHASAVKRRGVMFESMSAENEELFACGIALFNAGRFFACHEVWEQLWKHAEGSEKLFYQGLIQAAVALLHEERGNRRGALSTYKKARAKLDLMPTNCMGIALGEFRDALAEFFADIENAPTAARPQIRLTTTA